MSHNDKDLEIIISAVDEFTPKIRYIEQEAKDTKKKLDKASVIHFKANVVALELELEEIRKKIRKTKDWNEKIQLKIDQKELERQLKEAKRKLDNYLNTWNSWVSRLQAKFNELWWKMFDGIKFGAVSLALKGIQMLWNAVVSTVQKAKDLAISFESAFAGVKKTIDASAWQFQWLKKELKDLTTQIPLSFEEIAKIAELGWQLGIARKDIKDFTKTVANLWTSTNLSTEAAATSLARIANVFQLPASEYEKLGNVIVQLGNNFATTESEIVDFSSYLMASAKTAWFTADEVFAIGSTLSSVGIRAEAWWSAFSKAISVINTAVATGDKTVKDFAKVAGLSAEEFAKQWKEKPAEAFTKFVEGLGNEWSLAIPIIQELLWKNIRLQNGMLATANAGTLLRQSLEMAHEEYANGNALQSEADKRYETAQSKIQMLDNELNNMSETLGKNLVPAMVWWKELLVDIHWWINNLFGATDVFSDHLWELTDMITENGQAMKKLTQAYREGQISRDEYLSKLKELSNESGSLKEQYKEEEKRLKNHQKELESEQKSLEKSVKKRQELIEELGKVQQDLERSKQKYWENSQAVQNNALRLQYYSEKVKQATQEEDIHLKNIAKLEDKHRERSNSLIDITKLNKKLWDSQERYNIQLQNFNWIKIDDSKTRSEFEASKKSALTTAKAFETALSAKIAYLTWWKTLIGAISKIGWRPNLSPLAPNKELQEAIILTKKKMEVAKQISDLESLQFSWGSGGGISSWGGTWSAKSKTEAMKKELDKQRDREIKAVQESLLDEEEKMKRLTEIKNKYDKKKIELEGKTDDELLKEAEDYMKELKKKREDNYKDHKKKSDDAIKDVKKYTENLDKIKKKFEEIKEKAGDTLRDIKHNMWELDKNHIKDLWARYYDVKKQIRDNEKNESWLKRIWENMNLQTLESWRDAGQKEINNIDIDKAIEHLKLKEELLFLEQKTTKEQQEQAKIEAEKSESVKLVEKHDKEKATLQEKQNITEAFSSSESIDWQKKLKIDDDKVEYRDKNKEDFVEITDFKNQEYARDLINQQLKLETEYKAEEKHLNDSKDLAINHSKEILKIWQNDTDLYKNELKEREDATRAYVENVKAMMADINQAKTASNATVNNNQVTNSNNRTTNYNITNIAPKSSSFSGVGLK